MAFIIQALRRPKVICDNGHLDRAEGDAEEEEEIRTNLTWGHHQLHLFFGLIEWPPILHFFLIRAQRGYRSTDDPIREPFCAKIVQMISSSTLSGINQASQLASLAFKTLISGNYCFCIRSGVRCTEAVSTTSV